MRAEDKDLLRSFDWIVECESPLELRNEDGSVATGQAAHLVLELLRAQKERDAAVAVLERLNSARRNAPSRALDAFDRILDEWEAQR